MRALIKHYTKPLLAALLLSMGCSPKKDSIVSSFFHNTASHYNSYYYALEDIGLVEQAILKSLDDDHNQLLRLFPRIDTTLAKSYQKDTEEAIKMASISIQRHPNSKWLYKNYILVGLARLYNGDFQNAIQTFKYVNTKCNEPDIRHLALIHLMRTFTEMEDYAKAEETSDFLSKEKLSKENGKKLYLERAHLYQTQNDLDKMVQSLTKADSLLTKNDRKDRIYFIVGQVYQKLGFAFEAYNYYRKSLDSRPDYEIEFYARLNLAQVTQVGDKSNAKNIRKQLIKMLEDEKNKEFKDKIYFEIGEFELRQKRLKEAMENYRLCLRAGNSQRIKGSGYLRLGQLYYDSLSKYPMAKAYYDSAVSTLPEDTENLAEIKKRQSILADFVEYTSTIHLQDSLLALADLDTAVLRKRLDSVKTASLKKLEPQKGKKKTQVTASGADPRQGGTFYQTQTNTTGDWYFGNLSAVSVGQNEFQRIWGSIKLEDNWRRSVRTSTGEETPETNSTEVTATKGKTQTTTEPGKVDVFTEVYSQLPKSPEEKRVSFTKIEEAYFKLGDLYYFRLQEKQNAINTYQTLLRRFPSTNYRPETLYKLYLASREMNLTEADAFKNELIASFPESTFAKLLINPNYLAENTLTTERQRILYRDAYEALRENRLSAAVKQADDAIALGKTEFVPQLELLKILVTGKSEDITLYQLELGEFIKKYPDGALGKFAESLLSSSKEFEAKLEKAKGIRFIRESDSKHRIVIVHKREENHSTPLTDALEKLNNKNFRELKLVTTNLALDETYTLTFVLEFPDLPSGLKYLSEVRRTILSNEKFLNYKFDIFAITQENFGTFYRTKALAEYLAFYDRNYPK